MNNVAILAFALVVFGCFGKWGIVILILASIGLASLLIWAGKRLARVYRRNSSHQDARDRQQVSFVGKTISQDMPVVEASGSGKGFFIPKYRDVIVPDKHDFSTVVEFENQHTQWIYDVMAGMKDVGMNTSKVGKAGAWLCVAFFGILPALMGEIRLLVAMAAIAVIIVFVLGPMGSRVERERAKRFKDMTPLDWQKVYQDMQESENRANEIATAIRRSGVVRRHW